MTISVQRAWDMMKSLNLCFLVAETSDGMSARPMSSIVMQDEDKIYFLSASSSDQNADISALPNILLNYSNGANQFIAVSATATLSTDRVLITRLWNPGAQTFWPDGPEQAKVTVISATPHSAEYWDGPSAIMTLVKMTTSLVTGAQPDMGDNRKVAL